MGRRGQASFEILLMVGFIFGLSALVATNYLSIAPSIEGVGIVKSAMIANLAGMEPANALQSVEYGQYIVTDSTTGASNEQPSFTATIRDPLSSCGSMAIDDGFDQLSSIGGLGSPVIRVRADGTYCSSLAFYATIEYDSGDEIESPEAQLIRVADECNAVGKTPLLVVKSYNGTTLLESVQTDIDFGSRTTIPAMVLVDPLATQVELSFANDCCLGWNGTRCTRGGTDVTVSGIRLDDSSKMWSTPLGFYEDDTSPACINLGTLDATPGNC